MQNKSFGRLLKIAVSAIAINEGKAAVQVEEELGRLTGVTGASIQRYKNGNIPPTHDAIRIMVEAGVSRGFLSRDWAVSMLDESKYPHPMQILDVIFKKEDDAFLSRRTYNNLPAPLYSQFIPRPAPYKDIVDGLSRRSAVVLIVSMGGVGKSSLAREIAGHALNAEGGVPKFDAAVWISDKGKEGTTTLGLVLDEIAHTLEHTGIAGLPFRDKKREVEKLLRYQRVLLIIDNAETITDETLMAWLIDLPEPSKAIVTSRIRSEIFFNNTTWVKLGGMLDDEARELVRYYAGILKIETVVYQAADIDMLIRTTGGNPKAIMMALGYIKHNDQPLSFVLNGLQSARGELFDDLFKHSWNLLSTEAQHVLCSMALFSFGAHSEALSEVSGISGQAFQRDIERLKDLSLIDARYDNGYASPLYTLHQLVLVFVRSKMRENPVFEKESTERWFLHYRECAAKIGFAWKDMDKLKLLDDEGESETMLSVIEWCYENKRYKDVVEISKNARYYYYVRGYWSNEHSINVLRASSARELSDPVEEFDALVYHINIASKQGSLHEVEKYLPRLDELLGENTFPEKNMAALRHARALYLMEKGELENARALWEQNLNGAINLYDYNSNVYKRWATTCLYRMGKLEEARRLFVELIKESADARFRRGVVSAEIGLLQVDLSLQKLDDFELRIDRTMNEAIEIKDQMYIGQLYELYGDYLFVKGEKGTASEYMRKAVETFKRLGHNHREAEAEEKLLLFSR
jgi:tetratricopeptide (TPR) repeat protein